MTSATRQVPALVASSATCQVPALVATLLWLGSAVVASASVLTPVHRFAEPSRLASIKSEARPVLHHYRSMPLARDIKVTVPASRRIRFPLQLVGGLAGATRVVLTTYVLRGETWVHIPETLAIARREGDRAFIDLEVDLTPYKIRPGDTRFRVYGRIPVEGGVSFLVTPEVEIPSGGVLEFGFGVLQPAWIRGNVAFTVSVCADGDCATLMEETLVPGLPRYRRWHDRAIPLAAYAGKRVSFRFLARHLVAEGSFTFPVWSNPTVYAPRVAAGPDKDILLISIDTLRADHLTTYGYERDTAPRLDQLLAKRGTVFETCIASASTTAPSHMTMFTSLPPAVHGVQANTEGRELPGSVSTLAEVLRAAGFETGAATENAAMALNRGFGRGFDAYWENKAAFQNTRSIEATLAHGREWLERHRDKRSFLFLHTYQVHGPYKPPGKYRALFEDWVNKRIPRILDPARYDREIRYTDDTLVDFLVELERDGLLEDTIVVFTSDHGEAFLEHGFLGHGADIHEEVLHVPLILVGPSIPAGRRVSEPVGLIDLMPTLLELVGVAVPPEALGQSFASQLTAQPARPAQPAEGREGDGGPRALYSEAWRKSGRTASGRIDVDQPTLAVRQGNRKLIRYRDGDGFRYVYYDLAADPGEKIDRYPELRDSVADLRALIDAYELKSAELYDTLARAEASEAGDDSDAFDPERDEALRALGYIE